MMTVDDGSALGRPRLGAHMSTAGGLETAFDRGETVGCDTMQVFTKNNRQWQAPPIEEAEAEAFRQRRLRSNIKPVFAHAIYLLNLASKRAETREKSCRGLVDELRRAEQLGLDWVVMHPGSHGGQGEEAGLQLVAEGLCRALEAAPGTVLLALEGTAGQGSSLGHTFAHLGELIDRADGHPRLAVCLDTCHLFAAGIDLRRAEIVDGMVAELEAEVGLERLVCLHLNDSAAGLGQRRDRHAHIGEGKLGLTAFANVLNHPRLAHLPMVLETPKDDDPGDDLRNLATLRSLLPSGINRNGPCR